jgi:hypothetical protein
MSFTARTADWSSCSARSLGMTSTMPTANGMRSRVGKHGAPHVGECQPAAASLEELVAEGALERLQLVGDGGLGEAQLLAGLGDAAGAGHDPEVVEVVVVEPFHTFTIPQS